MEKYGLLICKENADKTTTIYKPIYSNDLKELVYLGYNFTTKAKNNETLKIDIFDYQKVAYVSNKTINDILSGKEV